MKIKIIKKLLQYLNNKHMSIDYINTTLKEYFNHDRISYKDYAIIDCC